MGQRGKGGEEKGRESSNQRERPWGGRQGRWLGGAGKREGGRRKTELERGRWVGKDTHTRQLGGERWGSGQPGETETERRSWEGKGISRGLSPEKEGGQMGRLLAPHGPE